MNKITRRQLGTLIGIGGLSSLNPLGVPLAWAADAPPKRGGVWRYARNRTVPGMDVQRASEHFTCLTAMYDYLVEAVIDPTTKEAKLLPGLATGWKFENDNKRVVMNLRNDVTFEDGSKFNATVAKWNLDRLRSDPRSYLAPNLKEISDVKVLNDTTIAIDLGVASASLLYLLSSAYAWGGIVSKAFQEKHGDNELNRRGCGSGAFRLKDWVVDDRVILQRNPNYWRVGVDAKPLPYLDGMEEIYRAKIDQAVIDLRTGGIDTVHFPAPRDVEAIRKDANLQYIELPPGEYQDMCCGFNPRKGPFTKIELRRACCYAIDREKLVKLVGFGVARPHMYPYAREGIVGWSPEDWPNYSYDPKKAAALVKAAYPQGVKVRLSVIAREPDSTYGELLKAMWEAVGIRTELKTVERLEWVSTMKKDDYDAGMWNGSVFPGGFVRDRLVSNAPSNWSNISNPAIDDLLLRDAMTLDPAKREELMGSVFKILYDEALVTSGTALTFAVGTHRKVKGIRSYWRALVANEVWIA